MDIEDNESPSIVGYRVLRRVDAGEGECWLVESEAGDLAPKPGTLRRLLPGEDPDAGFRPRPATREHEYVLREDGIVLDDAGRAFVLAEYAAGGSLARLASVRTRFLPGEVVTIAAPVARVLATMHAAGHVHGRLEASAVSFRGNGQPVVAMPRSSAAPSGSPAAPSNGDGAGKREDVRALAELCWRLIAGAAAVEPAPGRATTLPRTPVPLRYLVPDVPPELNALISRALDPRIPMTAGEFAEALLAACRARPVRLVAAADRYQDPAEALTEEIPREPVPAALTAVTPAGGSPRRPRRGRRRRKAVRSRETGKPRKTGRLRSEVPHPGARRRDGRRGGAPRRGALRRPRVPVLVIAGLVVASLGISLWTAPGADAGAQPAAPRPVSQPVPSRSAPLTAGIRASLAGPDPEAALTALSRVREELFRTLDVSLLAETSVEGSPARESDECSIAALRARRLVLSGLSVRVDGVRTLERSPDGSAARVRARSQTSSYRETGREGSVERPAEEPVALEFDLRRIRGSWLVYEIDAAA